MAGTTPLQRHSAHAAGLSLTRLMSVCTSWSRNGVARCGSSGPHVSSVLRTSVTTPCQHARSVTSCWFALFRYVVCSTSSSSDRRRCRFSLPITCFDTARGVSGGGGTGAAACVCVCMGTHKTREKGRHKQGRRAAAGDRRAGPPGRRARRRARRWSGSRRARPGWSCCGSTAARTRARPSRTRSGVHKNNSIREPLMCPSLSLFCAKTTNRVSAQSRKRCRARNDVPRRLSHVHIATF